MEENMSEIEKLLEKIHIDIYEYDESFQREDRSFLEVINDLAKSWEVLNDDYKDKLYEAMGIVPSIHQTPYLSYPNGIRTIPLNGDTGIEYIQNQPTSCEV